MAKQNGCGCLPTLIILGAVGYGGYYAYNHWIASDDEPAETEAVASAEASAPQQVSVPAKVVTPEPEPVAEPEEVTPEPEPVAEPEEVTPEPEPVAEPEVVTPEPEPVEALATLRGKMLVFDYSEAERADYEFDADEAADVAFEPVPSGEYGDGGKETVKAMAENEYSIMLGLYERKSDTTAELAMLAVASEPAKPLLEKMAPYMEVMPARRVVSALSMYAGDGADTYKLNFTSNSAGTAERVLEGEGERTVIRHIAFTVVDAPEADTAPAPQQQDCTAPAELNDMWMKLSHTQGDVWFYCTGGKIYRCNAEIKETETPPPAPKRFKDISGGEGFIFEDNLKRPYSVVRQHSYIASGNMAELSMRIDTIKRTFRACFDCEVDYANETLTYDGKLMKITFMSCENGVVSGYCEGVWGMEDIMEPPAQTLSLTLYPVEAEEESEAEALLEQLLDENYTSEYDKLLRNRLVELLTRIAAGADVNTVLENANGTTALHNACGLGQYDIVVWLLANGADVTRKTAKGATVKQCIGHDPDGKLVLLITQAMKQMAEELGTFVSRLKAMKTKNSTLKLYRTRLLTLLPAIAKGGDVNMTLKETKGNTALHYACGMGDAELVSWLIKHGADPTLKTHKGKTPWDCAGGDVETIRAILQSGAQQ